MGGAAGPARRHRQRAPRHQSGVAVLTGAAVPLGRREARLHGNRRLRSAPFGGPVAALLRRSVAGRPGQFELPAGANHFSALSRRGVLRAQTLWGEQSVVKLWYWTHSEIEA